MLSSILQLNINSSIPFGQLPIVRRFMKGLFELRPALPRYKSIWDLNIVFNYFRGRPAAPELSLKELTFLVNLVSGQRCQTIKYLNTDNMELATDKCIFHITDKVKQTSIGTHIPPLSLLIQRIRSCVLSPICKRILNERCHLERTVRNYF